MKSRGSRLRFSWSMWNVVWELRVHLPPLAQPTRLIIGQLGFVVGKTSEFMSTLITLVHRHVGGQVKWIYVVIRTPEVSLPFHPSDELKMNPSRSNRSGRTFLFTSESVGQGHSGIACWLLNSDKSCGHGMSRHVAPIVCALYNWCYEKYRDNWLLTVFFFLSAVVWVTFYSLKLHVKTSSFDIPPPTHTYLLILYYEHCLALLILPNLTVICLVCMLWY